MSAVGEGLQRERGIGRWGDNGDKSESDEKMAVVNSSRWPFLFAAVSASATSTLEHYRRANSVGN